MAEKRFKLIEDYDWWGITDNQLPKTEYGFREDLPNHYLSCDYKYNDLTHQEVVDLLNNLSEKNEQLKQKNQLLYEDIDFLKRFIEKRGFKAKLESDKTTEKQYCYILSEYEFYDASWIIMVSSSMDEIITTFTKKFRQIERGTGLVVKKYEFGKEYNFSEAESIRWVERDYDGKIKDIMEI